MASDFLNKFELGNKLILNSETFEIVNKEETIIFYDLEGKKSAGKQLEISLKNKLNKEEGFLLIFIEDERVVYNKRLQKLNANLENNFLDLLKNSKERDKVEFEGNIYELKNIVKSEIKDGSNIYPSINYILVSYINEKEKLSLSIFECNGVFYIKELEIKYIDKKEIQFI